VEPNNPAPQPNPFVGPQPLRKGQPIYARQIEIDQLYYMLLAQRIVLFYSPSGAGKSSLLYAGLIPRLTEEFDVWDPVRVNLAAEANGAAGMNRYVRSCNLGWEYALDAAKRRPDADLSAMSLADYVASRPRQNESGSLVLIFDQFEEVLTADPLALDARQEFFRQLGALLRNPSIWAVITLREDYLAAFDPYAELVPTHLRNRFRLDLFSRDAAAEALAGIAKSGGRAFAPDALDHFVRDLAQARIQQPDGSFASETGPYVEPLQLQVAGRKLWEQLPAGQSVIEEAQIAAFGDVGAALAEYYAGEVGKAAAGDERAERAVREWCGNKLIAPGSIRGQVVRGEGRTGGLENDLVAHLVESHLVRGEQRLGATWYELAHDRLIQPVQQSNTAWFRDHLSPLQKTAALWRDQHQDGLLFVGRELAEAQAWAAKNNAVLEDFEREFLQASEALQRANDQKRRNARLLKITALAASVFGVAAIVLWVVAGHEARTAKQTLAASAAAGVPVTLARENGHAEAIAALVYALRTDPDSFDARARITSLLTTQSWWLPTARIDFGTKKWLSYALSRNGRTLAVGELGGVTLWDVSQGRQLSTIALSSVPDPQPGPSLGDEPRQLQFSPDGNYLMILRAADKRGTNDALQIWDLATQRPLAAFHANGSLWSGQNPGPGPTPHIAMSLFSPDSKLVASVEDQAIDSSIGGVAGTTHSSLVSLWNPQTGQLVGQPTPVEGRVVALDFSPDSSRLLLAANNEITTKDADGRPKNQPFGAAPSYWEQILDAATGKAAGQRIAEGGSVTVAKFDPSGNFILVATGYRYEIRDAKTGTPIGTAFGGIGPDYPGTDGAFSPKGNQIVTNPAAQIWDWQPKKQTVERKRSLVTDADRAKSSAFMDATIINAAYTADGATIVTRSVVNGIQTWDSSGKPTAQDLQLGTLPGNESNLLQLGFSPAAGELFTGAEGSLLRVWRLDSSDDSRNRLSLPGPVVEMVMAAEQLRFLCWKDSALLVTDGDGHTIGQPIPVGPRGDNSYAWLSPDASRVVTGLSISNDSTRYTLWDVATGQRVGPDPLVTAEWSLVFDPYGPWVTFEDGNKVLAFDERSGASLSVLQSPGEIYSGGLPFVRFNPNGRTAILSYIETDPHSTQTHDSIIWDLQSGQHGSAPGSAEFTPDGKSVLSQSDEGLRQESQRSFVDLYPLSSDGLSAVADQRSGNLSSSLWDRFLRLFNQPPSGSAGAGIAFPGGLYLHSISHDGRLLLAVPISDNGVEIMSMKTGQPASPSIVPGGMIQDVQFSPDDRIVLTQTVREDFVPVVQLWSAATSGPISDPIPLPSSDQNSYAQFAFSAGDRDLLVLSSVDEVVQSYPVSPGSDRANVRLLADFAETVAGYRFNSNTQITERIPAEEQYQEMQKLSGQFHVPPDADLFRTILSRLYGQSAQ
jgi:WD40 repeat protein